MLGKLLYLSFPSILHIHFRGSLLENLGTQWLRTSRIEKILDIVEWGEVLIVEATKTFLKLFKQKTEHFRVVSFKLLSRSDGIERC